MLRIGFSSCFFHADPLRSVFKGKTLLYLEEAMAHFFLQEDILAYLIPSFPVGSTTQLQRVVSDLDGLVLQGGADVSPQSYGEVALQPEWSGDITRDVYECALVEEFLKQGKPIFGICRGAQLLNVYFGGTLYQDINHQMPNSFVHRNWDIYDQNFHEINFEKQSLLESLYSNPKNAKVNSIHHQGIKDLGKNLIVEARSSNDGIVEAFKHIGDTFVYAVQWHPEFHAKEDISLLNGEPLLKEFIKAAELRKVK